MAGHREIWRLQGLVEELEELFAQISGSGSSLARHYTNSDEVRNLNSDIGLLVEDVRRLKCAVNNVRRRTVRQPR